jgi:hypothetical protein
MATRSKGTNESRQPCVLCGIIVEVHTGPYYTIRRGDWEALHFQCEAKLSKLKAIMAATGFPESLP